LTVNKVDAPEEFLCELSGLLPQRTQRNTAKDAKNGKTIRIQVVRRDYHRCQGRHLTRVDFWDHFRVTGGALKNWLVAQL